MKENISIIGAGIGGLTMGATLCQQGYPVTIYESAPAIKPVGAGILMASNAMQVYKKLGLDEKIAAAGNRISLLHITDEKLRVLSCMDHTKYEQKYGVHNVAIHRAELQKILAETSGFNNIILSKRLSSIRQENNFHLQFEDDTEAKADVIIGADGIRSVVRNQLFNSGIIRDAGQVCWRGICNIDLPAKYDHLGIEAWGKGIRFGFVKIGTGKLYWFAVANANRVPHENISLVSLFKHFHTDILDIIRATSPANIFFSNIIDLQPFHTWHKGNCCLLGDAAHASTPNLGQGACQAVEDAYAIGQLLAKNIPVDKAFAAYEKIRIKKAHYIVNTSWRIGKIAHFSSQPGTWLRNNLMKLVPASSNDRQLEKIFDISYLD